MTRPGEDAPRFARALLELFLPRDDSGAIVGDLDEEFERFVCPHTGRRRARLWYWRQVLATIPGLIRRRCTEARGTLAVHVHHAARILARRPGFTVATVATLALAVAANTTVFGVAHAIVIRPLPFHEPGRLVRPAPDDLFWVNSHEAVALEDRVRTAEGMAAWGRSLFLFETDGDAEEVRGGAVAWDHFELLGVAPQLGRAFVRDDALVEDVLILSHALWMRRFGGDPSVVGATVLESGRATRVVGVMGPDHVPMESDWQVWRPLPLDPALAEGRGFAMNVRLRPDVSIEQAADEIRSSLVAIWAEGGYVATEEDLARLTTVPLREWLLGDARASLGILSGAVVLLLLLACLNVASLLVAQLAGRSKELEIRTAIGGDRASISRQLGIEVLLVGAVGVAIGLVLAAMSLPWVAARLPESLPRTGQITLSAGVALVVAVASLGVALVSALVPAMRAAGASSRSGLPHLTAGNARVRTTVRLRSLLLAGQVAVSMVLLVDAALLVRSLWSLRAVDPGFDPVDAVSFRPSPPLSRYPGEPELTSYYDRVIAEVSALPGVESVGGIQFLPMTPGGWWSSYRAGDAPLGDGENRPSTALRIVTERYFRTIQQPVLDGRSFQDGDEWAELRVVVNRTLARDAFGGEAVGRNLLIGEEETPARVIGVVGDVHQSDLRTEAHPEAYVFFDRNPWRRMHIVVRLNSEAGTPLPAIADAVRAVDPRIHLDGPRPLHEVVDGTFVETRLLTTLLSLFAAAAILLGALGVYGMAAQGVADRRREIGIRVALGATKPRLARAIVVRGMTPVVLGLAAGFYLTILTVDSLESVLFGVAAGDAATFALVPATILFVTILSMAGPLIRAARIDPIRTLNAD